MQYYYRLENQETWVGPYTEGRLCLFDAAWASQLGNFPAKAIAAPHHMHPDDAINAQLAIYAEVPEKTLIGNINHTIYEPPTEWIMAADESPELLTIKVPSHRLINLNHRSSQYVIPITVRPATPEDAETILDVQRRAFSRYLTVYTPHQINPLIETIEDVHTAIQNHSVYIALAGDAIQGSARVRIKSGVALITNISVEPEQEGLGIGTALLNVIEEYARGKAHKLYLETPLLGPQPLRFYIKLGYEPAGILRRHYVGVDWLAFEKFLF